MPDPKEYQAEIAYADGARYAYRPGEILVAASGGEDGSDQVLRVLREFEGGAEPAGESVAGYRRFLVDLDVELVVEELSARGIDAQPNHVLFADCCCGHPAVGWGGNPFSGNPFSGNPFSGNPFSGNPFSGNPFSGNPFSGNQRSLAAPTPSPAPATLRPNPKGTPSVAVLDVAGPALTARITPWLLHEVDLLGNTQRPLRDGRPDSDGDGYLDRVAGHGLFVAGRVAQVHPGCSLSIVDVLSNAGDGDEWEVASALTSLIGQVDIVNLSFGGYALRHMGLLAAAIRRLQLTASPASGVVAGPAVDRGAVIVASAGNDATCRAPFPAVLPGVISVAALGPAGPAPFTNFGPWVRACAAGVDVVSTFFDGWDGATMGSPDSDRFAGAATWSGTSFAAPLVAGKLAKVMHEHQLLPKQAVRQVIDAPGLARLPGLGTIVTA